MLKTIIFIYSVVTTLLKGIDLLYLYSKGTTNLPFVIIILQCIVVVFGLYLIFKRLINRLLLRELALYCIVVLGFTAFALFYIPQVVILELQIYERILVGTVVDLILMLVFLYYSGKEVGKTYKYVGSLENKSDQKKKGK